MNQLHIILYRQITNIFREDPYGILRFDEVPVALEDEADFAIALSPFADIRLYRLRQFDLSSQ